MQIKTNLVSHAFIVFTTLILFLFSTFHLIMIEERSRRRELLLLVFIVNCFKKPLLINTWHVIKTLMKDLAFK